jgi:hypothetical protein
VTAIAAVERLSLVKKAQASLLKDNLVDKLLTVDVSEPGVVQLSGITHNQELLDRIIEVVRKVTADEQV